MKTSFQYVWEISIYFSEEGFHNIFTRFFPWGEESYHGQLTLWIFYFCLANILKSKWTFREHLFLLPLSLLTSGRIRLGWPHFWSEDFLSDPSPIIALSCHWVTHSLNALVEFCSNWICQSCYTLLFSKLLDRFVKIVTGISLSCYMDLSKLIHTCYLDLLNLLHGFLTALAAL